MLFTTLLSEARRSARGATATQQRVPAAIGPWVSFRTRGTGYNFATTCLTGSTTQAASNSTTAFNRATISGEQVQLGFRVAAVPEPATWVIGAPGLAYAAWGAWRRRDRD